MFMLKTIKQKEYKFRLLQYLAVSYKNSADRTNLYNSIFNHFYLISHLSYPVSRLQHLISQKKFRFFVVN